MKIIRNTRNCVDIAFYCHVMYDINDFIYGYGRRWNKDDEDDIITKNPIRGMVYTRLPIYKPNLFSI